MASMELRQLRYFVAVAEVEHFRQAALRLNVAQPALSQQIKLLEDEIGTKLFERLPRGVRLSDAGRSFLVDAKTILAQLDEASQRAHAIGTRQAAPLRIAFSEMRGAHPVILESVQRFRERAPQVKLDLSPMPSRSQETALAGREVDACFLYLTPASQHEFSHFQIGTDQIFAAMPQTHALAKATDLTLHDLAHHPIIWIRPTTTPRLHTLVRQAFVDAGIVPPATQEASSAAHMLSLISMGLGIGLISDTPASRIPRDLLIRPIRDLDVHVAFEFAWHRKNDAPALALFIEIVREVAAKHAADAEPLSAD